jgi:predicted metal-dependent hydrolase
LTDIQRDRDYCSIVKRALARLAVVLSLVAAAASPLAAQGRAAVPSPHPLAVRLAAASEPLSLDDLVDAAFTFSGVGEASLPAYRLRLLDTVAGFQRQVAGISDPAVLGAQALEYLHTGVLRRYDLRQARVDTVLDTGTYNCVSSAVLYLILARSVGLSVGGVRTADHTFCTVKVGAAAIDVETTSPYGFNPGARTEFKDSFGRTTGFAYTPPSNYAARTPMGERGLLALILYDLVSFAVERGDHADALQPAATAWVLSPDGFTRGTLVTALSNFAVWLGQAQRFDEAVSFLEEAERAFGADADLTQRRRELVHNQAVALVESGELDAADALLSGSPGSKLLGAADRTDLLVWVVYLRADISVRKADYAAAAEAVADGIARIGAEPRLLDAYEAYVHDRFAQLFNAKRFSEAKASLEAAQARYPGSRIISQDLETVTKALKR